MSMCPHEPASASAASAAVKPITTNTRSAFDAIGLVPVAIIGTAGRKEDAVKMNNSIFLQMVKRASHILHEVWKLPRSRIVLVSGGAAWADHVAVRLYNEVKAEGTEPYAGIEVFMPCELVITGQLKLLRAIDVGGDWKSNPGWLVNKQHSQFTRVIGVDTLNEFKAADGDPHFKIITKFTGMYDRDAAIARRVDRMIAFTWGEGDVPKRGGTRHTWDLCRCQSKWKIHVPLARLKADNKDTNVLSTAPRLCGVKRKAENDTAISEQHPAKASAKEDV